MKRENIRIRDPFVFTEEGKYYLLGTTGNDSWNKGSDLTLFVSDDLENFESCGTLVLAETLGEYTQIWAPELHKYNGNYYLIVSVFNERYGRGSILLTADTVKGPFTPLTGKYITPEGWWCLDATLFCKDGKPYLYFSNEWICTVTNDGDGSLFVAELSPDLKEIVGRPKKIVSGKYCGFSKELTHGNGAKGYVAEGPFVLEENGKTALYWSTYTKKGYCVVRSTADEPLGEYTFDKFIFKKDGGHAMLFFDRNGEKRITFHQPNRSPDERMKIFSIK